MPSGTDSEISSEPPIPQRSEKFEPPVGAAFPSRPYAMTIRWYRLAVFALWLAATSWLMVRKILPPFFIGEPPAYESAAGTSSARPWHGTSILNERRLGWALSEISQQTTDTTEIHSLVHFDRSSPGQAPADISACDRPRQHPSRRKAWKWKWRAICSPIALNQLVSFDSKFRPKCGQSLVKIDGNVEGDKLKLEFPPRRFCAGDARCPCRTTRFATASRRKSNCGACGWGSSGRSSPTARSCRPSAGFASARPPTEVLLAKVEDGCRLTWNGKSEPTWLVVYRSDTERSPGSEKNIRNRLWVRSATARSCARKWCWGTTA